MKVYWNGRIVDPGTVRIDPGDRGFALGDGLYETIRVRAGQVLRGERHLARLHAGARTLGIPLPDLDLDQAMRELLAACRLEEAVLRLTLTRGPGPRGLMPPGEVTPTLLIVPASLAALTMPIRGVVALSTRRNEHSPTARCKTLNGLDNIVARREAVARGADDALLLNTAGQVAESTAANLFAVIDGCCVTPPESDGALPGVMREDVLAHGEADIRSLAPSDLLRASEAFLTNALGIRALIAVDGQPIGDGLPGPVTQRVRHRLG